MERDFASYHLYKSADAGKNFVQVNSFYKQYDTTYIDKDVDVDHSAYCYYLVMHDTCNNKGPAGYTACTILLSGSAAPLMHSLDWTAYQGWPGGIDQYMLMREDMNHPFANLISFNQDGLQHIDEALNNDEGLYNYRVVAHQSASSVPYYNASSSSNIIELRQSPILYLPNAFTANGDNLNEQFRAMTMFVKDFEFTIFNRWGQIIFHTTDKKQSWNGSSDGIICPEGVYFYTLKYSGWDGSGGTRKGMFTLLR
jgi:gliding motility-associated-like protein